VGICFLHHLPEIVDRAELILVVLWRLGGGMSVDDLAACACDEVQALGRPDE
jgi:hypothetical protein